MSAHPQMARIPDEELDLLLSRSLDADLSPDEERDLERYLSGHPEARQRRDALAAIVADLRKLPPREPPFALASRVHNTVTEKSTGLASVWHRFGIYPAAGVVPAMAGVMALGLALAVYYDVKRPPVVREQAQKPDDGPLEVFFQESTASKKEKAPAVEEDRLAAKGNEAQPAAPAPAPPVVAGRAQDRDDRAPAKDKEQARPAESKLADASPADRSSAGVSTDEGGARSRRADGPVPAQALAQDAAEPARPIVVAEAPQAKPERQGEKRELAKSASAATARREEASGFANETTRVVPAGVGSVTGSAPAAPPAAAAPAPAPPSARVYSVSISTGSDSWRVARPPSGIPPSPLAATLFRLTLDADGRVTAVRAVAAGGTVRADVEEMLRALALAPVGRGGAREVEVRVEVR